LSARCFGGFAVLRNSRKLRFYERARWKISPSGYQRSKCAKLLDAVTAAAMATNEAGQSPIGLANALELNVVWADTSCLKANIHFPVDWLLLSDACGTLMKRWR